MTTASRSGQVIPSIGRVGKLHGPACLANDLEGEGVAIRSRIPVVNGEIPTLLLKSVQEIDFQLAALVPRRGCNWERSPAQIGLERVHIVTSVIRDFLTAV